MDTPTPALETWLHMPTMLAITIIVMLSTATVMSIFGATHRVYRGYWVWVTAMWLAPLGAGFMALRDLWPAAVVPGALVLMGWPMLILTGLRRFYVRDIPSPHGPTDLLVYLVCFGLWLAVWISPAPMAARMLVFSAAILGLHLYASAVVARMPSTRASSALKMLVGVMLVLGLVPLLRLGWALNVFDVAPPHRPLLAMAVVLPLTIGMLFTVYLCLVLTHERTVQDLRETQRQLRVLADIDMLTQVPNRRRIEELAERIVGKMAGKPTVLMLFDIDHFKRINDTRGHAAGDEALRVVANCARETLRSRDVLGRIGGDEFMLLLPGASVDHALQIADRITRRLDAQPKAGELPLGLSFGVVQIEPGETIESARRRADSALYEAKRQGRRRAVPAELRGPHTVFGESRPLGLDPLQPV